MPLNKETETLIYNYVQKITKNVTINVQWKRYFNLGIKYP